MKSIKATAILSLTALFLAACSSPPINAPVVGATVPIMGATASQPSEIHHVTAAFFVAPVVLPAYLDPKNPIASDRSVYFGFDEFVIKEQFTPPFERHGRHLASTPALAIRIEGSTDERGSAEYDLALGQKRAEAIVRSLKLLGVKDTQMEAMSWGKEKPKASGHDNVV